MQTNYQIATDQFFNWSSVFLKKLSFDRENHVPLPKSSTIPDIPPENVVRVILIYGRSHSETPNLSDKKAQQVCICG